MSDQPGSSNGDHEPMWFGGPIYDEATARKILEEVVLEEADSDEEDGEAVVGFDPNDAALNNTYVVGDNYFRGERITPLIYFARKGDVKMCRYLISRGASTTKLAEIWYPMCMAAEEGHLDVCKVLYANGAQNDVRRDRDDENRWTPFHHAACLRRDEVLRWLTLHGALCADGGSDTCTVEGHHIYPAAFRSEEEDPIFPSAWIRTRKGTMSSSYDRLVEWAKEVTQSHSSLMMFLLGALPPAPDTVQSRTLQCLCGHPGVRKHIGDFVGLEVTKGKHLRILRNVVDVLPSFIKR